MAEKNAGAAFMMSLVLHASQTWSRNHGNPQSTRVAPQWRVIQRVETIETSSSESEGANARWGECLARWLCE